MKRLLLVLLAVVICAVVAVWIAKRTTSGEFSEQVWKNSSLTKLGSNPDNPRGPMVSDLMENHLTPGMSRREVLSLLGTPDEPSRETDEMIWYYIGGYSGGEFIRGSDHLVLEFSEDGSLKAKKVLKSD